MLDFGARVYHPELGRFLSLDPAAVQADKQFSFNRYIYANNNPYKYKDPDGRNPKLIADFFMNLAINYATQGQFHVAEAALDTLTGAFNPAKTVQKAQKIEKIFRGEKAASKVASESKSIWTATKSKSSVENAFGHWQKHRSEFLEINNAKQYVDSTKKFMSSSSKDILEKTRNIGDVMRYHPSSNTFGVMRGDGPPKTMFRPSGRMDYWNRQ